MTTTVVINDVPWGPVVNPPVVVPPPVVAPPPVVVVPPAGPPYPLGWNRTGITWTELTTWHPSLAQQVGRYLSIVDQSGNPSAMPDQNGYNGFDLETFRIRTREGPRGAGAHITLHDGYIEVLAQPGDHADGTQLYGGSGLTMAGVKTLAGGPGATCIFAADGSHGVIDLDGDYFGALPGAAKPNHLICVNLDGADSFGLSNAVVERGVCLYADLFVDPAVKITRWLNVVDQYGKPWAQPHA